MTIIGGVFTYFLIWWLVLFAVLPWGVTSYHEAGEEAPPGGANSAPMKPRIIRKFVITSLVSAVIWGIWAVITILDLLPKY